MRPPSISYPVLVADIGEHPLEDAHLAALGDRQQHAARGHER